MKINKRVLRAATGLTVAATAGTLFVGVAPAQAAGAPWEPDPNTAGTITFYDASGSVITHGSTATAPFAAYAVGTPDAFSHGGVPRAGDTQARVLFANPDPANATTATWFKLAPGSYNAYPLYGGSVPANIATASQTEPVVVGDTGDAALDDFISAATPNTAAGYANVYQIRLQTANAANQGTTNYDTADVLVDPVAHTWTQVYPKVVAATSTVLTSSANPTTTGANVTLTATESPAVAGSVQFKDGTTNLSSPVAVDAGGVASTTASFSTTGTHHLSAVFTPTDTSANGASTGLLDEVVNPPATATKTTASATSADGYAGHDVSLSATVVAGSTPVTAGTVSFYDGASTTPLNGSPLTPNASGTATLDLPTGLPAGNHTITAKFTPTDVTQFEASSGTTSIALSPAPSGSCTAGSTCTDPQQIMTEVPAGTITISTPYNGGPGGVLDLGQMQLVPANGGGFMFHATGTFDRIHVTDTRAGIGGANSYTVSALSSNLTGPGGNLINAQNVGLTNVIGGADASDPGFSGTVTPTNGTAGNPAANAPVAGSASGSAGLAGGPSILSVTNSVGSMVAQGTLTINAPTSTATGTYTGTITFTVA